MTLAPAIASASFEIVPQRSGDDCMVCALAMMAGRSYDEVVSAAQREYPAYRAGEVLPQAVLRRVAHGWGLVLLSSIYMDWRYPGIVGVASRTLKDFGHALFWTGETLIDPSLSGLYDRAYIEANAIEFTQRAGDLGALIGLERGLGARV